MATVDDSHITIGKKYEWKLTQIEFVKNPVHGAAFLRIVLVRLSIQANSKGCEL